MLRALLTSSTLAIGTLAIGVSCHDDGPTIPQPVDSQLYVAMNPVAPDFKARVLIIDCKADSIVDSVVSSEWTHQLGSIFAAPHKALIAIPEFGTHVVFDVASKSRVGVLAAPLQSIVFISQLGMVIGAREDSAMVFSDTSYALRAVIPYELLSIKRIRSTSEVIGLRLERSDSNELQSTLLIYDLESRSISDSFYIDPLGNGSGFQFSDFDLSSDGCFVYAVGADQSGTWLIGYSLKDRSVMFRYPRVGNNPVGACRTKATPDGSQVWVTWGHNAIFQPWPQSVYVFGAKSGELLDTVDVSSSAISWPEPVTPFNIRFTMSGEKAYIGCGSSISGGQPLIVLDAIERKILKVLFADASRTPASIDIGPAP